MTLAILLAGKVAAWIRTLAIAILATVLFWIFLAALLASATKRRLLRQPKPLELED